MTLTRDDARRLDRADPLASFRDRFVVDDPDLVYLDGNSLGRLPKAAAELAERLVRDGWGRRLIRGWNDGWIELPERLGAKIARLVGAEEGEVVVADSTTVNLFKLAVAALRARPERRRVLTDDLNFPSDLYALGGACDLLGGGRGLEPLPSEDGIHGPEDALRLALADDAALLSLTHTVYKSGFVYDMPGLTEAAHAAGALALWDLSHSVGSVPVDLNGAGADLAVGCTYKYVNGGPGAPAFLYVRRGLQDELANPVPGWMGKKNAFDFGPRYEGADGVRRFLTGTPPVLSTALIEPGVDLLLEAGMDALREKSLLQTEFLLGLVDAHLLPLGFVVKSPREAARRGSHVSLGHPDALQIDLAMIDAGVIPDFRPPDNIRLGVAPLYTRFEDLYEAVARIRDLVAEGRHEAYRDRRPVVT